MGYDLRGYEIFIPHSFSIAIFFGMVVGGWSSFFQLLEFRDRWDTIFCVGFFG